MNVSWIYVLYLKSSRVGQNKTDSKYPSDCQPVPAVTVPATVASNGTAVAYLLHASVLGNMNKYTVD